MLLTTIRSQVYKQNPYDPRIQHIIHILINNHNTERRYCITRTSVSLHPCLWIYRHWHEVSWTVFSAAIAIVIRAIRLTLLVQDQEHLIGSLFLPYPTVPSATHILAQVLRHLHRQQVLPTQPFQDSQIVQESATFTSSESTLQTVDLPLFRRRRCRCSKNTLNLADRTLTDASK